MSSQKVHIIENTKKVLMPYNRQVAALIAHAQEIRQPSGNRYLVLPHNHTETKILSNLGYDVPAPILTQYDWSGVTPFASQRVTAAMMSTERRCYVLNSMGTGKTLATLFAYDYLRAVGEANRMLVVAPLSTLNTVWANEVFIHFPHLTTSVLHGAKARRLKYLNLDSDIYIINHDGVETVRDALEERRDINVVAIDELATYRNRSTDRWKSLNRVVKPRRWVWGLTGAPIPKAPTDAYAQIKLITPMSGPHLFKEFRNRTMTQVTQFRWIPQSSAKEKVYEWMQPSVRFSLADCVDLPPTTISTREVAFTSAQKKAYSEMMKQFYVDLKATGGEVKAANAGVQMSKLLQIACGFAYDTNSTGHDIGAAPRVQLVKDLIDEAEGKVIVFAPFRHTLQGLTDELNKEYAYTAQNPLLDSADNMTPAMQIHGGISARIRERIFAGFQHGSHPRIIVAHPKVMAHGLTLTAGSTIIWYAPYPDNEVVEQANARIARPGQKMHTHIINIQGSAVERKIYTVLSKRGKLQTELLDMFRDGAFDKYQ